MRLGEIYSKCKRNYKDIKQSYKIAKSMFDDMRMTFSVGTGTVLMISENFINIKKLINEELGDIKYLKDTINELNSAILNDEKLDKINDLVAEKEVQDYFKNVQHIVDLVGNLLDDMMFVIRLCESLGVSTDKIGLDIKIPETDSITEFKKYIDGLEFIFTKCPFFQNNEASLKFKTVDVGSMWLIMWISCVTLKAGSKLLNSVAAFIDKCMMLKSYRLSCEKQKYELEISKINQKEKEIILESIEKMWKISVDNAIRDLEEVAGIEIKDGDERGRVEQSFDRLEKLIDKGLQIHASIDSSKEVKAVFEPLEMYYLSKKDVLEQIEEKPDKDVDDDKN